MDVHDVGDYKLEGNGESLSRAWSPLLSRVSTFSPGTDWQKWWNIGIRIEDDVLVTSDGHEIFSSDAPKTVDEIEALMATARVA